MKLKLWWSLPPIVTNIQVYMEYIQRLLEVQNCPQNNAQMTIWKVVGRTPPWSKCQIFALYTITNVKYRTQAQPTLSKREWDLLCMQEFHPQWFYLIEIKSTAINHSNVKRENKKRERETENELYNEGKHCLLCSYSRANETSSLYIISNKKWKWTPSIQSNNVWFL